MKLIDALEVLRRPSESAQCRAFLACGFEPLHLKTFLAAHFRLLHPNQGLEVVVGRYGDLCGNLERLDHSTADTVVVVIEWGDLDSRLAIRNLGGWRTRDLDDAVLSSENTAARLYRSLAQLAANLPTVVCIPTLPFPPIFSARPEETTNTELRLRHTMSSLAEMLSRVPGIRIVNGQVLDETSPVLGRYDLKSDLNTGFPYSLQHASAVGKVIASVLQKSTTKKGLITDLDNTVWDGILGEDGAAGISWTLENKTHLHGLYQQLVASLASAGVLIGVASKNEEAAVLEAFERQDLLISRKDIFPFEVHWSSKSRSVERILAIWNISPDSVVFIDDSPMEVAEVQAAFPDLECIVFPKGDHLGVWNLLRHLRSTFGNPVVTEEAVLRLSSIRDSAAWRAALQTPDGISDDFLKAADGCLRFELAQGGDDARAFELVNKTNQFNLNGRRFSESSWKRYFADPAAFLLVASYRDKFGPLGKVAVLFGTKHGRTTQLDGWVLSCRAFSRRIEHQCLRYLFDALKTDELEINYSPTPRNAPLRQFLRELCSDEPAAGCVVTRERFDAFVPALFHRIEGEVHV